MLVIQGLHDSPHLQVVSVISSFDCNGHVLPLYVRINGEALKVHKAVLIHESTFSLITFRCEVIDQNQLKPLKLNYHVNEFKWTINI